MSLSTSDGSKTLKSSEILVFARVPDAGKNKTRLIPALGPELATRVYAWLAKSTLQQAREAMIACQFRVWILFCGGSLQQAQEAFGDEFLYDEQIGEDLGAKMAFAVQRRFEAGASRVVVIGTDCMELTSQDLQDAFAKLEANDLVLGPARDGGYYLIGLTRMLPNLFTGIEWSTNRVLAQTEAKAHQLGISPARLPERGDIDEPEDLLPLRHRMWKMSEPLIPWVPGRLSILIPTLNEELSLPKTLEAIRQDHQDIEVILADGGSTDKTIELAQQANCRVLKVERGRGRQLNAAASIASGEWLLFLHADTQLPKGFYETVRQSWQPGVAGGAFRLRIDAPGVGLRCLEFAVNWRSRHFQLPYGDQGMFVRASDFYRLGGFKSMPIMEDFEWVERLQREGRIALTANHVVTSARRWQRLGLIRTTIINQICVLLYRFGVSPQKIARFYRGRRRTD